MQVRTAAYGPEALDQLTGLVGELKAGDPMRPVTLLVTSNVAGLAARRHLAQGVGGRPGVAALEVTTLPRWAEQLAGPSMVPRRPATQPVVAAAVRRSLAERGGPLAKVAGHPATIQALTRAHAELLEVDPATLDVIAQTSVVTGEVVALHRAVRDQLQPSYYEPVDLVRTATRLTSATGDVVVYLPQRLTPSELALLRRMDAQGRLTVLAGLTGDPRADAEVRELVRRLAGAEPEGTVEPRTASRVLTASDADDEVRVVVREVVERLRTTRADRVAVLYAAREPYARLLHEHLTVAGTRHHGPGVLPVADRAMSRLLLGVLALPDCDMARVELFDAVSDAPTQMLGSPIPTSSWERISRAAGVVAGEDWERRLDQHVAVLQARPVTDEEQQVRRATRSGDIPTSALCARPAWPKPARRRSRFLNSKTFVRNRDTTM